MENWFCKCGLINDKGRRECFSCGRKLSFHVFSNGEDEYFFNYANAVRQYIKWKHDIGCARLYSCIEELDGDSDDANCLKSFGDFPT